MLYSSSKDHLKKQLGLTAFTSAGGGDYYGNGNGGGEGKHDGGSDRQVFSFDDSDRQLRPAHLPSMMGRPAGESGANTEWGHK